MQDQQARAEVLAALEAVDLVVIFEQDTPVDLIRRVKPTVLVKGADYRIDEVVGRELVEAARRQGRAGRSGAGLFDHRARSALGCELGARAGGHRGEVETLIDA